MLDSEMFYYTISLPFGGWPGRTQIHLFQPLTENLMVSLEGFEKRYHQFEV